MHYASIAELSFCIKSGKAGFMPPLKGRFRPYAFTGCPSIFSRMRHTITATIMSWALLLAFFAQVAGAFHCLFMQSFLSEQHGYRHTGGSPMRRHIDYNNHRIFVMHHFDYIRLRQLSSFYIHVSIFNVDDCLINAFYGMPDFIYWRHHYIWWRFKLPRALPCDQWLYD